MARTRLLSAVLGLTIWVTGGRCLVAQVPRTNPLTAYPTPTEKLGPVLSHDGFQVAPLLGTQLSADPAIGHPTQLAVQGQYLWIGDRLGDPFVHLVDITTGKLKKSLGPKGEGPGDFHDTAMLGTRPGDPEGVWVFDYNLSRMTSLRERQAPTSGPPTVPLRAGHEVHGAAWLNRNEIVMFGLADTARFMFSDTMGRTTSMVAGPQLGSPAITKYVREIASNGELCVNPSGQSFIFAYHNASRIDLFDRRGKLISHAEVPIPNVDEGNFYKDAKGVWHKPSPRSYYNGCFATPTRLYTLFSGRLRTAGPDPDHPWHSGFVHVFDWSGKLLSIFKLDQLAEAIAVSGDSVLYAGGEAMDGIFRYRLPASLPPAVKH